MLPFVARVLIAPQPGKKALGLTGVPRGHIPRMATIVRCNCGAEYKRTETKFLVPHTGDAVCTVCGAALESWWTSTHIPSFELVKRPDGRPPPEADPTDQN